MKCITCDTWSFSIICENCQKTLLKPSLYKRQLDEDFYVYSFYSFDELEELLTSKYYFHGDRVLNILARLTFGEFSKLFYYPEQTFAIGIDDHTRHDFSHTAILSRHLDSKHITPLYNSLKATNKIKYAGKDLEFRQKNPRKFKLKNLSSKPIILVDDLVTTGTTLLEAKKCCKKSKNEVLFALTLADAKI